MVEGAVALSCEPGLERRDVCGIGMKREYFLSYGVFGYRD